MKKVAFILVLLISVFSLVSCGSNGADPGSGGVPGNVNEENGEAGNSAASDERTLGEFISAFTDEGIEVDEAEKPMFEMIGAVDGVIFYIDNSPVKIYEFESENSLTEAKEAEDSVIADWPSNGRYVLETKNESAIEIFSGIK